VSGLRLVIADTIGAESVRWQGVAHPKKANHLARFVALACFAFYHDLKKWTKSS